MNTNHMDSNQMQEQEIDLIELFYKLLAHWRWFLLAAVVALAGAYIYVHVTTPSIRQRLLLSSRIRKEAIRPSTSCFRKSLLLPSPLQIRRLKMKWRYCVHALSCYK